MKSLFLVVTEICLLAWFPVSAIATSTVYPASVISLADVGLAFDRTGIVTDLFIIHAKSFVKKGQILAILDTSELRARMHIAETEVDVQQLKLNQLQKTQGIPTDADIRAQNALDSLLVAKKNVLSVLQDSYTKAEDAVHNRVDQIFSNPKGSFPQLVLSNVINIDANVPVKFSSRRVAIENLLTTWKAWLDNITALNSSDLNTYLDIQTTNLLQIKDFLDTIASALNATNSDPNLSQLQLRSYKTDLYTGRVNVNTGIKDVIAVGGKERDAENALAFQQATVKRNDSADAIMLQQALLKQAIAKKELLDVQISKMTLRAPATGIITRVITLVGSVATANKPVFYFRPARTQKLSSP